MSGGGNKGSNSQSYQNNLGFFSSGPSIPSPGKIGGVGGSLSSLQNQGGKMNITPPDNGRRKPAVEPPSSMATYSGPQTQYAQDNRQEAPQQPAGPKQPVESEAVRRAKAMLGGPSPQAAPAPAPVQQNNFSQGSKVATPAAVNNLPNKATPPPGYASGSSGPPGLSPGGPAPYQQQSQQQQQGGPPRDPYPQGPSPQQQQNQQQGGAQGLQNQNQQGQQPQGGQYGSRGHPQQQQQMQNPRGPPQQQQMQYQNQQQGQHPNQQQNQPAQGNLSPVFVPGQGLQQPRPNQQNPRGPPQQQQMQQQLPFNAQKQPLQQQQQMQTPLNAQKPAFTPTTPPVITAPVNIVTPPVVAAPVIPIPPVMPAGLQKGRAPSENHNLHYRPNRETQILKLQQAALEKEKEAREAKERAEAAMRAIPPDEYSASAPVNPKAKAFVPASLKSPVADGEEVDITERTTTPGGTEIEKKIPTTLTAPVKQAPVFVPKQRPQDQFNSVREQHMAYNQQANLHQHQQAYGPHVHHAPLPHHGMHMGPGAMGPPQQMVPQVAINQ
eukprot:gene34963-43112_t